MKEKKNTEHSYLTTEAEKIAKYFIDEEGIFTTEAGLQKGVYAVYIQVSKKQEVLMYIGECGREERCLQERLAEHAHFWTLNPAFYCGIKPDELEGGYKFKIKILAVEEDNEKRYKLEQYYVENLRPYMQSGPYPKYDSKYRGLDLAIFPTYRRRAFLFARDGKISMEGQWRI